ncbi:MAG: sigma 54-interacting transcriptional regulator [Mailhella sp.]|nr:sigma 54-interacting transcriptional regulator [Mailhella sp.]
MNGALRNDRYSMESIREQWESFQNGDTPDPAVIRDSLHASWVRSRQYGVDPFSRRREFVSPAELNDILEQNRDLVSSAVNIMGKLYQSIEALDGTITLADKDGVVLYSCQPNGLAPAPSHVIGDILSEQVCGTNGIGTCLVEKHPVELIGAEHYSREEHSWYCSSAPVYDSKSNIIGVFNISIPCGNRPYYQTSGLVGAIAHAITEQIFLSELLSEQLAILNQLNEGVIVLNADGVIKSINKKACAILHPAISPEGQNFRRIFHTQDALFPEMGRSSFQNKEVTFISGIHSVSCQLSCSPLPGGGCVLILQKSNRMQELASRTIGAKAVYTFDRILGESESIKKAIQLGKNAAKSDITTLILGESGTGKELFAQSIHNAGSRHNAPFIVVNCGAIPRNLVQSELFGYSEGSFTGAMRQGKPGKFELADGGTIFLDEIGEMPLDAQVSLLRLLQNGEVTRVGSKRSRYVNVRVIAATNRDLEEALNQKAFRQDLYYRLNAFILPIPPLNARYDDVCLLADNFLQKFSSTLGKHVVGFEESVYPLLRSYSWPGNVRELENCIERAVAIAEGEHIRPIDLPAHIMNQMPAPVVSSYGRLKNSERETICHTLAENNWNLRKSAVALGISRSTLYLKIKKFGIERQ